MGVSCREFTDKPVALPCSASTRLYTIARDWPPRPTAKPLPLCPAGPRSPPLETTRLLRDGGTAHPTGASLCSGPVQAPFPFPIRSPALAWCGGLCPAWVEAGRGAGAGERLTCGQ